MKVVCLRILAIGAAAALVALGCAATSESNDSDCKPSQRNRSYGGIYVMKPDGTGQRRVADSGISDTWASWSPSGRKLSFSTSFKNAAGGWNDDVCVATVADHGAEQLTAWSPVDDSVAAWSPDGRRIAFMRGSVYGDKPLALYVMRADGQRPDRLAGNGSGDPPSWSPDSRRIAFAGSHGIDFDGHLGGIRVVNLDGSGLRRLTRDPRDTNPAWSPDGKKILFVRWGVTQEGGGLFLVSVDGTGLKKLVPDDRGGGAAWSPSGDTVVVALSGDLYTVDVATRRRSRLTASGRDGWPNWSPDGTRVAFARFSPDGANGDIWTIRRDGTTKTRLTRDHVDRYGDDGGFEDPKWSPDGTHIAFVRFNR